MILQAHFTVEESAKCSTIIDGISGVCFKNYFLNFLQLEGLCHSLADGDHSF